MRRRRVRFISRELDEEEEYVVKRFTCHVAACLRCKPRYSTDTYLLCEQGTDRLRDAKSYLYLDGGGVLFNRWTRARRD